MKLYFIILRSLELCKLDAEMELRVLLGRLALASSGSRGETVEGRHLRTSSEEITREAVASVSARSAGQRQADDITNIINIAQPARPGEIYSVSPPHDICVRRAQIEQLECGVLRLLKAA